MDFTGKNVFSKWTQSALLVYPQCDQRIHIVHFPG